MKTKIRAIAIIFAVTLCWVMIISGWVIFYNHVYLKGIADQPVQIFIENYKGKVIQVDRITTTTGGFLFSNSRSDTYVTFDNGKTYWLSGNHIILENYVYYVHSETTIKYGSQAGGNGTLTTTVNTLTQEES